MTFYTNSFEGGTPAAAVTVANSGGASGSAFASVTAAGVTYDNTVAAHGTLCANINTPSAAAYVRFPDIAGPTFSLRLYAYFTALPAAEAYVVRCTASGPGVLILGLLTTGKLRIRDAGGATLGIHDTPVLPLNTWLRIEVVATQGATAATASVDFGLYAGDSTTPLDRFTTSTANLGTVAFTQPQIGQGGTGAIQWYLDDVAMNTAPSGFIGPWTAPPLASVRPATVTSNAGAWVNQGGAASLQAALADESDTTYAETPALASGQSASFTTAFTPLSAGDVTVKVRHQASAASPAVSRLYELLQGSTVIASSTVTLPTAWTDYAFTTTPTQTSAITDRTALAVRVTDTSA